MRRQISAFVRSDIYSKYLQAVVFIGVLAAGEICIGDASTSVVSSSGAKMQFSHVVDRQKGMCHCSGCRILGGLGQDTCDHTRD